MANNFRKIDAEQLWSLSMKYVDECIEAVQQHATNSGKVVNIPSRMIPTIGFFCDHWMRRNHGDFYSRQHFHKVLKWENHPLCDTLKRIDERFQTLAIDIVANEGKGIFYAKNKLGMTDKQQVDTNANVNILNIDPIGDE